MSSTRKQAQNHHEDSHSNDDIGRFPPDFMFEINKREFKDLRSQFVTSNSDKMGLRCNPMAFT